MDGQRQDISGQKSITNIYKTTNNNDNTNYDDDDNNNNKNSYSESVHT